MITRLERLEQEQEEKRRAASGFKTAAEIEALRKQAGLPLYSKPVETKPSYVTQSKADTSYQMRQEELKGRLRRYSSISLMQRLELKQRAISHMGGGCKLCGYNKCARALEFHHLERQNKQFSISTFIGERVFKRTVEEVWAQVESELRKCVLLCANCHREVEAGISLLPQNE